MINLVLIICLVLVIWLFVEPNLITVKRIKLKDKDLQGLRIIFASDFHIKYYEKKRLEKIVNMINAENPDLILSTGDNLSSHFFGEEQTAGKMRFFASIPLTMTLFWRNLCY